jgi:hypothetical protein
MSTQTNSVSSVRAVFTRWGECIRVASEIGSVSWVVVSIIIAGRSVDPMFAKLASVVVVGIFPGLALTASGIAASAVLWTLGFLYDCAEPYVVWWSAKSWRQGRRRFSVIRAWTAINLPRYWRAAIYICAQGKKGLLSAPGKLFFGITAPIRFAARTALTVAPSSR